MLPRPAQRLINSLNHLYLHNPLIEHPPPWLPKRVKSILLRRQITKTIRGFHILREAMAPSIPALETNSIGDLEPEAARKDLEVEEVKGIETIDGMKAGKVAAGSVSGKKLGAQNGRMSTEPSLLVLLD